MSNSDPQDWNTASPEVKQRAVYDFCKKLDEDTGNLREDCRRSPRTARDTFREVGNFVNLPEDLPIYACEDNEKDRSKVMAIILPAKGQLPSWEDFDIKSACPCTWTPYVEFMSKSLRPAQGVNIHIRVAR